MHIYVASSWRNTYYPEVVQALRDAGHEVYDFRNPPSGDPGFHWSDVDEQARIVAKIEELFAEIDKLK